MEESLSRALKAARDDGQSLSWALRAARDDADASQDHFAPWAKNTLGEGAKLASQLGSFISEKLSVEASPSAHSFPRESSRQHQDDVASSRGSEGDGKRGWGSMPSFLKSEHSARPDSIMVVVCAAPSTVDAGEPLMAMWGAMHGAAQSCDWLGLFRVGEDNSHYIQFTHCRSTNGGTWATLAPKEPGVYVFRFISTTANLTGRTHTTQAESHPVTVGAGTSTNGRRTTRRQQLADLVETAGSYFDNPSDTPYGSTLSEAPAWRSVPNFRSSADEGDAGPSYDNADARLTPTHTPPVSPSRLATLLPNVVMPSFTLDGGSHALSLDGESLSAHRSLRSTTSSSLRGTLAGVCDKLMGVERLVLSTEPLSDPEKTCDVASVAEHVKVLSDSAMSSLQRKQAVDSLFRMSLGLQGRTGIRATPDLQIDALLQLALDGDDVLRAEVLHILLVLLDKDDPPDSKDAEALDGESEGTADGRRSGQKQEQMRHSEAPISSQESKAAHEARSCNTCSLAEHQDFWVLVEAVKGSRNALPMLYLVRLVCVMLQAATQDLRGARLEGTLSMENSISVHVPQLLPVVWRSLENRKDGDVRERAAVLKAVCCSLVALASSVVMRDAVLACAAGMDTLRFFVCMIPQWLSTGRTRPLWQTAHAFFLFSESRPQLVAEAGGLAAMLAIIRSGVSREVLQWAVWTLERLVQWHVQSSIGNDVVHPQSPGAASFALPDVIDAVVKEIPALVSVMSAEPELSLPVTKVLSNAARLDGSTRVFRKVMTCVSPSGREHLDYASLPSSGNLSPSPFVRLTCTPVASTDSSMAGRKKDADLAAERERVGESMPSPSLSQSEVRGGVDAICVMLSQLQLQSQAEASNEADGDHVKRKNGHSECLAFATQCVSAISDPSLALDSEKGALVLEDIHKHGVSMASARHVQHLAGDRYWEFPTWLEGVWEEEDDKHPAAMDTPLENLSDDPVARHEMKLLTQAWLYFRANGGRRVIRTLMQVDSARANIRLLGAVANMTRFEGNCCWLRRGCGDDVQTCGDDHTETQTHEPVSENADGSEQSSLAQLLLVLAADAANADEQRLDTVEMLEMARAATTCIANFCACAECRDHMSNWEPLCRLSNLRRSFPDDADVCRQAARGLQYLCAGFRSMPNPDSPSGEFIRASSCDGVEGGGSSCINSNSASTPCDAEFRRQWEEIGVGELFELGKSQDMCVAAWAAKGMKFLLKFVSAYPEWSSSVLKLLMEDRRPLLLLKLINQESPLISADAMEGLAYISALEYLIPSSANGAQGQSSKRALYLNGCMYSVISFGSRGLPCVTVHAANVMANLSKDPDNLANMLDLSRTLCDFLRYLLIRDFESGRKGLVERNADDSNVEVAGGADTQGEERERKPEKAWSRLAGWYTAPACGAYGWENDPRLMKHAQLLAHETIYRICCAHSLHNAFVQCGGLELVVDMAKVEHHEENCDVLVAQAIAALAKGEQERWKAKDAHSREKSPREDGPVPIFSGDHIKELKCAIKGFFAVKSEAVQRAAENALAVLIAIDASASAREISEDVPPVGPVQGSNVSPLEMARMAINLTDRADAPAIFISSESTQAGQLSEPETGLPGDSLESGGSEGRSFDRPMASMDTASAEQTFRGSETFRCSERSTDFSATSSDAPVAQIFESNITDINETSSHASGSGWSNSVGDGDARWEQRGGGGGAEQPHEPQTAQKLRWQLGPCIGKGAFAEVYQGIDTITGKFLAVKKIKLKTQATAAAKALEREIDVMTQLPPHRNIVKYLGTDSTAGRLFIFLEYISGGSIQSMLHKFGALDECIVRKYTMEVLNGLDFLHIHNVVHCDIKGGNILVTESGVVKLADFNSSKLLEHITWGGATPLRSLAGTPQFMAPEVIRQTGHDSKADIWSVGCTVIQMLTAAAPWNNISNAQALMFHVGSAKNTPPVPEGVSDECRAFLTACFQLQPEDRPTCKELLCLEFVACSCAGSL